jgi:hypothetical protein
MRHTSFVLCAAVGLVLLASACGGGGGGGGRYEETGLNITFSIPDGFAVAHNLATAKSAGSKPVDQAGVGPTIDCPEGAHQQTCTDPNNLIVVQRFNLNPGASITAKNIGSVKAELDGVIGNLAGKTVSGHEAEYGGLPGYEYVVDLTDPVQGRSRIAVLFDGGVEYLVNCQSTPDSVDRIEKACRTVLDSIEKI